LDGANEHAHGQFRGDGGDHRGGKKVRVNQRFYVASDADTEEGQFHPPFLLFRIAGILESFCGS
jgi:hypothetical protein